MIENHLLIVQNIESILHMNEKDWYMEQFPAIMIFVISIKKGIKTFLLLDNNIYFDQFLIPK